MNKPIYIIIEINIKYIHILLAKYFFFLYQNIDKIKAITIKIKGYNKLTQSNKISSLDTSKPVIQSSA